MFFCFCLSSAGAVPDEKFPVMVWFHPGDFHWGTPMYWDASVLATRYKVRNTKHSLKIRGSKQTVSCQRVEM